MSSMMDSVLTSLDELLAWVNTSLGVTAESYCTLETADSRHALIARDGSFLSIIRVHGATQLVGPEEFQRIHQGLTQSLSSPLSRRGHAVQFFFEYDKEHVQKEIRDIYMPARQTAERLHLNLDDLFDERTQHLAKYTASERMFMVLWTRPSSLTEDQMKQSLKMKNERLTEHKAHLRKRAQELLENQENTPLTPSEKEALERLSTPPTALRAQNMMVTIPELRETHSSFVNAVLKDLQGVNLHATLLSVHDAVYEARRSIDPEMTGLNWKPRLPGDPLPMGEVQDPKARDISELLWPPLARQVIPRDAEILDLRTCRIGDRLYAAHFIDLFPQEIKPFSELFNRSLGSKIPWRISYFIESDGLRTLGIKPLLASFLAVTSSQNKLIDAATQMLRQREENSDMPIVKLRVALATWAPIDDKALLRARSAELLKAVQGWGQCEVSEISGDSFASVLSSALAISDNNVATASVAPLEDVVYMTPFNRPASPWSHGAVLLRSPDGKPWPYQPGSTQQTTWIDLIYARPGSGKSVLSNALNLGLCLQGGIKRLPRIAIIDIGPSSSGLISLIQEALPQDKKHLVGYHRLRMTPEYAINPFDTQLGCRHPTPQERSFLVNFLTLLATPVGQSKPYDGISDMAGIIVDELYETLSDGQRANIYTRNIDPKVDKDLDTLNIHLDEKSTWWEVTDALFAAGKMHTATLAQRYASPLLSDAVSICRSKHIEDLYGKIIAPTGESLISAFGRMISSAVREYPILSKITAFDLGETRIVSLDLDEVAKSGGEAADKQTAVMYMLARYIMARHYYLTEENVSDFPTQYRDYHRTRILEIREDPKRIVMDEFHRTSRAQAVRDQVLVDMREGRKWKVQVALLSQSLDDFDPVMVEFATSIFIMDAGPKQAVDKSVKTFGLSETARLALTTRVHGPRAEGATFLAQFATKMGINTQLCTATLGPIELWAFNTTAEDARIRNALYQRIGASETRRLLATLYPSGSAAKVVEERLTQLRAQKEMASEDDSGNVIEDLINEIHEVYKSQTRLHA